MIGKIVEFTSVGDSDGMLTYCENRKSVRGGQSALCMVFRLK